MIDATQTWHVEHKIDVPAAPHTIWSLFCDVPAWTQWNPGIERIEIEGPFHAGTWFNMKPPEQDIVRSKLVDVRENEYFIDETRVEDLVVTVTHRIETIDAQHSRVIYSVEAVGPNAAEIGSAVSSDFPDVLAALAALAARRSS